MAHAHRTPQTCIGRAPLLQRRSGRQAHRWPGMRPELCLHALSVWIYRVPCSCSDGCPTALLTFSVYPYRYPIEPAIPPLVFEMKRLGMFSPCWSCEGHLSCVASISKLPKLWFYCDSTVYLRLLATGVNNLKHAGRLQSPWQIAVTFSDLTIRK